ncbi:MAG: alpha-amylase [Roseburia sp.]|nr:alpha-amylase [Roseburia sp.]
MAWYEEAVFYHIYPLGLTGAPKQNDYGEPVHRLADMKEWIDHIKETGFNAIYIGPLFESVGHGYETTDYKKLDSRLGDNADLKDFVATCHEKGIRVIFDGVFNHTGRDFFAFKDIKENRENSRYKDWYCNVNFWGNNEYNDGFSYDNWGGYNLLVKLNQRNPEVRDYICDVIRFWVSEFDVDGIRLDAADVLDFDFMKALRHVANEVKPEFWLMGEVIHGDYCRWANSDTLHSVTNYHLHKALYSGHNDHNYFEIAHTVKRLNDMGGLKLYNFTDNHDVERIYTKLNNKKHYTPAHILCYTLPGVPSVYYGSEFGIEGKKERWSDDSLRPELHLEDYKDARKNNPCTALIAKLGKVRQEVKALSYGDYRELMLTTRQYAFSRSHEGNVVVVTVNNDESDYVMTLPVGNAAEYIGVLSGQKVSVVNGNIVVNVKANDGDIWIPYTGGSEDTQVEETEVDVCQENCVDAGTGNVQPECAEAESHKQQEMVCIENNETGMAVTTDEKFEEETEVASEELVNEINSENIAEEASEIKDGSEVETSISEAPTAEVEAAVSKAENVVNEALKAACEKAFEEGKIAGLQEAILARMERNGYVTDQMRNDVRNQTHIQSLINWVKSF